MERQAFKRIIFPPRLAIKAASCIVSNVWLVIFYSSCQTHFYFDLNSDKMKHCKWPSSPSCPAFLANIMARFPSDPVGNSPIDYGGSIEIKINNSSQLNRHKMLTWGKVLRSTYRSSSSSRFGLAFLFLSIESFV